MANIYFLIAICIFQRLNVALSRARSLLILIGNPRTLSINSDFKNIIELCQVQKTLVGASFFDDDGKNPNKCNNESMSKLTKSLEKLNISKENINACGKNGGKSNKARARARKNMANNNKNVAAATTMNEGTTTVNDVLKSNNSSKFKSKISYFYYNLRCMKREKAKLHVKI